VDVIAPYSSGVRDPLPSVTNVGVTRCEPPALLFDAFRGQGSPMESHQYAYPNYFARANFHKADVVASFIVVVTTAIMVPSFDLGTVIEEASNLGTASMELKEASRT